MIQNDSLIVLDRMRYVEIFSEEFKKEIDGIVSTLGNFTDSLMKTNLS